MSRSICSGTERQARASRGGPCSLGSPGSAISCPVCKQPYPSCSPVAANNCYTSKKQKSAYFNQPRDSVGGVQRESGVAWCSCRSGTAVAAVTAAGTSLAEPHPHPGLENDPNLLPLPPNPRKKTARPTLWKFCQVKAGRRGAEENWHQIQNRPAALPTRLLDSLLKMKFCRSHSHCHLAAERVSPAPTSTFSTQ